MAATQNLVTAFLGSPKSIRSLSQVQQLHTQLFTTGSSSPLRVVTLISFYTNFNLLRDSLSLFRSLCSTPPLAWRSIIRCYSKAGLAVESLASFADMRACGVCPDHSVLPTVLKCCAFLIDFRLGEAVHGFIIRLGLDFDLYTGNALINMFAKFQTSSEGSGLKIYPSNVFERMPDRRGDPVTGSSLDERGSSPISIVEIVGLSRVVNDGNFRLQEMMGTSEFPSSDEVCKAVSSGELSSLASRHDSVIKVFEMMPEKDIVSWNTVIAGCAQNGTYEEALKMVREMARSNLKPDSFTLSSILPVFTKYVDSRGGKEIHGYSIRHGLNADVFLGSSLIDMYGNCNRLEYSCHVFNLLPERDDISWNSVIAGCVQNGLFDKGVKLLPWSQQRLNI